MNVSLDDRELEKLADLLFAKISARLDADRVPDIASHKLFYTESEAADMLGISPHTLKRARLNGEIVAATVGKPIRYGREEIVGAKRWLSTRGGAGAV